MSQEGYADPIMNDGPGFHSIIPLASSPSKSLKPERSRQATKLSSSSCEKPRTG